MLPTEHLGGNWIYRAQIEYYWHMLLLLSTPVWASHVVQVSEQVSLGQSGTFARPFLDQGSWYLGFGAGQGFWISPLLQEPWALPPRDEAWRL